MTLLSQSGHVAPLDRNGDGRLTPGLHRRQRHQPRPNKLGANLGFFSDLDLNDSGTPSATSSGNMRDILWVRLPHPDTQPVLGAVGTLAHEYSHLVRAAVRIHGGNDALREAVEVLWLD